MKYCISWIWQHIFLKLYPSNITDLGGKPIQTNSKETAQSKGNEGDNNFFVYSVSKYTKGGQREGKDRTYEINE